jgi:hypothetical protein
MSAQHRFSTNRQLAQLPQHARKQHMHELTVATLYKGPCLQEMSRSSYTAFITVLTWPHAATQQYSVTMPLADVQAFSVCGNFFKKASNRH